MSSTERCAGVFNHAQVVEDQASGFVELGHFLSDAAHVPGFDQTDGEAAQAGDVLGAVAGADAAAVLVIVPIEDVMAAVFDGPVVAVARIGFDAIRFLRHSIRLQI